MAQKHKIEIFSAGCATCTETIDMVRKIAGPDHEVQIHDMHQEGIATRAKQHGVRCLPAAVIDGKLADVAEDAALTNTSCAKPSVSEAHVTC